MWVWLLAKVPPKGNVQWGALAKTARRLRRARVRGDGADGALSLSLGGEKAPRPRSALPLTRHDIEPLSINDQLTTSSTGHRDT